MAAHECLACGAAFQERKPERCADCGGEFFVSPGGTHGERRPVEYRPGDHAAVMYSSDERCMRVLLPYVRDGVAAGHRVIGVVDRHTSDVLRARLTSAEARRVEMITPAAQYGDTFSADRTYDAWSTLIAATDGIVRGFGGLDEPTARSVDPGEWARYERSVGGLLKDEAVGLCLYDARYCSNELLEAGAGHPLLGTRDRLHVCN